MSAAYSNWFCGGYVGMSSVVCPRARQARWQMPIMEIKSTHYGLYLVPATTTSNVGKKTCTYLVMKLRSRYTYVEGDCPKGREDRLVEYYSWWWL